jgi:hypothetical protein
VHLSTATCALLEALAALMLIDRSVADSVGLDGDLALGFHARTLEASTNSGTLYADATDHMTLGHTRTYDRDRQSEEADSAMYDECTPARSFGFQCDRVRLLADFAPARDWWNSSSTFLSTKCSRGSLF